MGLKSRQKRQRWQAKIQLILANVMKQHPDADRVKVREAIEIRVAKRLPLK